MYNNQHQYISEKCSFQFFPRVVNDANINFDEDSIENEDIRNSTRVKVCNKVTDTYEKKVNDFISINNIIDTKNDPL